MRQISHRVIFPFSGKIKSLRKYIIWDDDGGTFKVYLEEDDGTSNHFPSGKVIGETFHYIGAPPLYKGSGPSDAKKGSGNGNFRELFFEQPVFVQQGVVYHFVFKNTSRDPKSNFVSVDDFISSRSIRTKNKIVEDPLADAVLSKFGGDRWTVRQRHWSIGEYLFEDGRASGNVNRFSKRISLWKFS